jgi:type IV secretion system protein VirB9
VNRTSSNAPSTAIIGALILSSLPCMVNGQPSRMPQPVVEPRAADSARTRSANDDGESGRDTLALLAVPSGVGESIASAIAAFRATGVARAVSLGTVVALPFGRVEPVVTCAVLRACIIELEAGEHLSDVPVAGDPVRWSVDSAKAGPGGQTPLVLVKPRACDVTTNLVVPTDRRVYDLTLDSPPCARGSLNPRQAGVRHVRFYYPDDASRPVPADAVSVSSIPVADPPSADPLAPLLAQAIQSGGSVNRDYRVVRRRRGPLGLFGRRRVDFPWRPAAVADDGARTYVALPAGAAPHAAPVFYAVEQHGSRTMVNYAVRSVGGRQVYVADRVVRRVVLVLMDGAREQRLEFENRAWARATSDPHSAAPQPRTAPVSG